MALQTELVRQVVMQPARRRVSRLAIWPAIDLVSCGGVLLVVGSFFGDHWSDWDFVVPATVVMICAFALLASCIRQFQLVAELDWSGPVAKIQCGLEKLRVVKIRQFKWIILLSPLLWFCGLMVGLHWFFGGSFDDRVNILDKIDPWWVVANYAFGVLFVPLGYFVAGVLAARCHRQRWWRAVLDGISGNSLKAAAGEVERWADLQREAPGPSGND